MGEATATAHRVTGLAPDAPYRVRVRGYSRRGVGAFSAPATLRTLPAPPNAWGGDLGAAGGAAAAGGDSRQAAPGRPVRPRLLRHTGGGGGAGMRGTGGAPHTEEQPAAGPSARRGHAMASARGYVYLFGGATRGDDCGGGVAEGAASARGGGGGGARRCRRAAPGGGGGVASNELWQLDPVTSSWQRLAPAVVLDTAVSAHPAEVQTLTCTATLGTFKLAHGGQATPALPFGATALQVQSALRALSTIAATTAVSFSAGGAACSAAGVGIRVTFTGSAVDETPLTADASLLAGAIAVAETSRGGPVLPPAREQHTLVGLAADSTGVFGAAGGTPTATGAAGAASPLPDTHGALAAARRLYLFGGHRRLDSVPGGAGDRLPDDADAGSTMNDVWELDLGSTLSRSVGGTVTPAPAPAPAADGEPLPEGALHFLTARVDPVMMTSNLGSAGAARQEPKQCVVDLDVEVELEHPCLRQLQIELLGPGPGGGGFDGGGLRQFGGGSATARDGAADRTWSGAGGTARHGSGGATSSASQQGGATSGTTGLSAHDVGRSRSVVLLRHGRDGTAGSGACGSGLGMRGAGGLIFDDEGDRGAVADAAARAGIDGGASASGSLGAGRSAFRVAGARFRPDELLSAFDGAEAEGVWTLRLYVRTLAMTSTVLIFY